MKKNLLFTILLFSSIAGNSQSKGIVGSWISLDSINKIHFFINTNGTIAKSTAVGKENVWTKTPKAGTYTFEKDYNLVIKWQDKSIENIKVKFIDNNAEFQFADQNGKLSEPNIFLRIVDEEIKPDK